MGAAPAWTQARPAVAALACLLAAGSAASAGCAASRGRAAASLPSASGSVERVEMEPMALAVVGSGSERHVEAYDAGSLFQEATADLSAERFEQALAGYDRVAREFPQSKYVVAALYNAGLAAEGRKDYAAAADRYRALVARHGDTPDALDALFRMGACLAELERWGPSAEAFGQLLAHPDLPTLDRLEALARRGLGQYHSGDKVGAEHTFREAMTLYRERQELERLDGDFFVAMSQYYLAELAHDEFRLVPVRLPEAQMKRDLEEKARLLLAAQGRYVDVARLRNVAWATAAGYQMARLYREFYDAVMAAPAPPMSDEQHQVYLEELRKFLEPLLLKAIHAHELTQMVAQRNGVDNDWVRKSSEELEQLRALVLPATGAPASALPAPAPLRGRPLRPELEKREPPRPPVREQVNRRGLL